MREDIYGGIKNALERGYSIEQAVKSFTNAGYKEAEVREAARALENTSLAISAGKTDSLESTYLLSENSDTQAQDKTQKKGSKRAIIILVITLIILVAALAGIFLFQSEISGWIRNIIS